MNPRFPAFRVLSSLALFVLLAPAALAASRSRVETSLFAPLHAPLKGGAPIRISNLPLMEANETIVLEEFDVLSPEAVIEVFDENLQPHRVTPAPLRQFRGHVAGDPTSLVYLAVTRGTRYDGVIITRDTKFALRTTAAGRPLPRAGSGATEIVIEEVSAGDLAAGEGFVCDVEKMAIGETPGGLPRSLATSELNVKTNAAPSGTQRTVLNLAISTDAALYSNFGSSAANVETFVRNLVGAVSTIYLRDLGTEVRIPYLQVTTTTDPWAVNPGQNGTWNGNAVTYNTSMALYEFGDYWHNTPPSAARRSAAALLSGQSQGAGIAWIQRTCMSDFQCGSCGDANATGHWGGAYSYNGGLGSNMTVPNPDALANYGAPSSNYWPLLELAHEFGHNVQSDHTHCITLSASDQATYGRTYVDNCYSGQCYSGPTSLPADGAGGRGTIMSYCHLLPGGGNNMRYTLGQPGEASHTVRDAMRARLDAITPTGLSAITAPASVSPGVGGQAASVTNTAGMTFDWTITNGTFTGGGTTATGNAVTFTGNSNPVTLKVYMTNSSGCAISDTKTVTVGAAGPNAPANVSASASTSSSVTVTWNTVSGATSGYNVYRSTDNINFTLAGNTAGPPFIDGGRSANTGYVYKVRATNGTESSDSNRDFAVTTIFSDSITAQATLVRTSHFTEIITAANALRAVSGIAAISFTQGTPAALGTVRRTHVIELRAGIDLGRTSLGLSGGTYTTDATITAGTTTIKKAAIDQMRAALQ